MALLNVEVELLLSLKAGRLEKLIKKKIKKNRLINLSIQKGYMAKVPGCREPMSLI